MVSTLVCTGACINNNKSGWLAQNPPWLTIINLNKRFFWAILCGVFKTKLCNLPWGWRGYLALNYLRTGPKVGHLWVFIRACTRWPLLFCFSFGFYMFSTFHSSVLQDGRLLEYNFNCSSCCLFSIRHLKCGLWFVIHIFPSRMDIPPNQTLYVNNLNDKVSITRDSLVAAVSNMLSRHAHHKL